MKLEKTKIDVEGGFGIKSYDAEVSQEDMHKMWEMFQNPYKNNIGSLIRETVSNGFDSHSEVGSTAPVTVKFDTTETGYSYTVKDVGVGISPERVKIIKTYLKSTKNTTNDQIGGIGIGFKSPLSYRDYFTIKTVYNGTYYHYIMRKGEIKPSIDLIEKKPLEDVSNYSEVIVDIKNQQDLEKFIKECYNQLYYFNNVVIDYDNIIDHFQDYSWGGFNKNKVKEYLNQDYKVIEGKHFYCRLDEASSKPNYLHISNGNVKYPIDWDNIGLQSNNYTINLGLKFDIGELSVIFTREDIRYTESNIKKVKEKIELVKEELTELINKETKQISSFESFINICLQEDYWLNTINQNIPKSLINFDKLELPKYKDIKFKDISELHLFTKSIRNYVSLFNLNINSFKKRTNSGSYIKTNDIYSRDISTTFYSHNSYNWLLLFKLYENLKSKPDFKVAVKSGDVGYKTIKNKYLDELGCKYIIGKPSIKLKKSEYKRRQNNTIKLATRYLIKEINNEFKKHIIDYDNLVVPDSFKPVKVERITKPKNTFKVRTITYSSYGDFSNSISNLADYNTKNYFNINSLNKAITEGKNTFGILINSDDINLYKDVYYRFFKLISEKDPVLYIVSPTNYTKLLKEKNRKFITIKEYFNTSKMKYKIIPEFIAFKKFIDDNPEFKSDYFLNSFIEISKLPIYKENTDFIKAFDNIKKYSILFNDAKFKELTEELTEGFKKIKLDDSFSNELKIIKQVKNLKIHYINQNTSYSPFLSYIDKPLEESFVVSKLDQKKYLEDVILEKDSGITIDNYVGILTSYSPYKYSFSTEEELKAHIDDKKTWKEFMLEKISNLLFNTSYITGSKLSDFQLVNYYIKNK
jgi:hypothetical protein